MKANQKKKLWIGIVIGAVISVLTLGALFVVFLLFVFLGDPPEVTTDITKYEQMLTQYDYVHTAFITFPEQLPESAQDTDFYFYYQDTWNTPTMEVFLQCTYDEADYQTELARLENTRKRYGSRVQTLIGDEEGRYPYPAYIAVDGRYGDYEYALLSGEREITYIYIADKVMDHMEKVDAAYLPSDFENEDQVWNMNKEAYSIYLQSEMVFDGEVIGWNEDYTRDEVSEVLEHHYVEVDYNNFYVTTCLDENDAEIIQDCSYSFYKNQHDSMYGLPEKIVYTELTGYRFKSLELNEEQTKAIVTYYDGEEEKIYEYVIPEV